MTAPFPAAVRIATRASQLAQWQANHIADLLSAAAPGIQVELVNVTTTGDRVQSEALSQFGGVGVFTREVQHAVLDCRADIAVHSLKDLPTEPTPGLVLGGVPDREVHFDALVLPATAAMPFASLNSLPSGARVGTGSLRRQAQLRHRRPDLELAEIRGNVDTRLRKLDAGEYDALILAAAGLIRLGLAERISQRLEPPVMYPAVGQGAIGIECRSDDHPVQGLLERITNADCLSAVTAERSLLATLQAGCHAPVGVHAKIDSESVELEAVILSADGSQKWIAAARRPIAEATALGGEVAHLLLAQGAKLSSR